MVDILEEVVRFPGEVGPQWLLYKLQPPIVGIVTLQAATFNKCCNNSWLAVHSPTNQGGSGIESNTHSHTQHTGAWTQEPRKGLL